MSPMKISTIPVALLAAVIGMQIVYAESFSSYLPDSEETVADDDRYDLAKQPSFNPDDKLLYRLLTRVFLENFNRASRQRMLNAQLATGEEEDVTGAKTPFFRPTSGRSAYGLGDIVKRKVFWQPLGYLPSGKKPMFGDTGSSGGSSRVNIIRYG